MEKILMIGASGFIGQEVFRELTKERDVIGTYYGEPFDGMTELDITQEKKLLSFLEKIKPNIIVHLAAITDVDLCEKKPEIAYKVHVEAMKTLGKWVKENNARFIFFSTDFVFDGTKGNYFEGDKPNPINVYGKTKYEAEKITQELEDHLILRLSTPYGSGKTKKFINYIIEKLKANKGIYAATDLRRSPTFVGDIAKNFPIFIEKKYNGILHIAGDSQLSMYEVANIIAETLGLSKNLITPVKSEKFNFAAKRPLDTTLNISKIKKLGIKMKSLQEGVLKLEKENII